MINGHIEAGGILTFWSIADYSDLQTIQDGLAGLGLGDLTPLPRTKPAALKSALQTVFRGRDYKVEVLDEKDAFEVIHITRGERRNVYDNVVTAKIMNDTINLAPYDDHAQPIVDAYNHNLGMIDGEKVVTSLVSIIAKLGGTRVRPRGGLYWLNVTNDDPWNDVAKVIESAGHNSIYKLRHEWDADAVRIVLDSITVEIKTETERLHKEIMNAPLGETALLNRQEQAQAMRVKIKEYEDILGVGLSSLTEQVEKAEEAFMTAALAGSGMG